MFGSLILLAPSQASAACTKADRAGSWKFYSMWSEGKDQQGWTKCDLTVDRDGVVGSGTFCEKDASKGDDRTLKVRGGNIGISKNCRVTGAFKIGTCKATISRARITKDKWTVNGIGKDCTGAVFDFTAVKE
ncbi:MAG: hypothetical protein OEM59_18355 [Rhodospirillales bacterium]|nr:hypothetical protein [Rhodospirillales bacterium]